jgi:hypothetical protein
MPDLCERRGTTGASQNPQGVRQREPGEKRPGREPTSPGRRVSVRADSACLLKLLEALFGGSPSGRILCCIERRNSGLFLSKKQVIR